MCARLQLLHKTPQLLPVTAVSNYPWLQYHGLARRGLRRSARALGAGVQPPGLWGFEVNPPVKTLSFAPTVENCPFFTRNAWYSRLWYSAGIPPGILIWRGILGIPAKNLGISWYTQTLI